MARLVAMSTMMKLAPKEMKTKTKTKTETSTISTAQKAKGARVHVTSPTEIRAAKTPFGPTGLAWLDPAPRRSPQPQCGSFYEAGL
jgi:hypothetical protein